MQPPNYDAVLRITDGKYYFYIKELGLVARGDDLGTSYGELVRKRDLIMNGLKEADLLQELPSPAETSREDQSGRWLARDLGTFSLKMLIVSLAISALIFVAVSRIVYGLNRVIDRAEAATDEVRKPWKVLEEQLYLAADASNEMRPEKQERIIKSIGVLVKRAKPFVDEVRPLFSCK